MKTLLRISPKITSGYASHAPHGKHKSGLLEVALVSIAIKLSVVGAGHARDQGATIRQSPPKYRGRGPLLRPHCLTLVPKLQDVGRNKPSKSLLGQAEGRVVQDGVSGEFGRRLPETPVLAIARTRLFQPTFYAYGSHAECGNDKTRTVCSPWIKLILIIILGLSTSEDVSAATDEITVAQPEDGEEITRRRPGEEENEETEPMPEQPNRMTGLEAVSPPDYQAPPKYTAIEDRWRLPVDLGLMNERWFDPYNFNVLKADRPFAGKDWFFNLGILSDTVAEPRRLPPTLASGSTAAGDQFLLTQSLSFAFNLYKGETVFRPPDFEFRFNPVLNTNFTKADAPGVLYEDQSKGTNRWDYDISLQQLSVDMHLRTVSDRYDFDRLRVGIQPFTADFRGFLFLDNPVGVRLYGNRDNNLWQYNLAWFRRAEKSTNSGLNEIVEHGIRDDDVFVANLYRQDFPVRGFTSQGTVIYNRNREGDSNRQYFDQTGNTSTKTASRSGRRCWAEAMREITTSAISATTATAISAGLILPAAPIWHLAGRRPVHSPVNLRISRPGLVLLKHQ